LLLATLNIENIIYGEFIGTLSNDSAGFMALLDNFIAC
jgi:hypothetical protein